MTIGEIVWKVAIFSLGSIIVGGLVVDLFIWLILGNAATVTIFLRDNPAWFWWPAIIYSAFVIVLAFHLFFLMPKIFGWG